MKVEKKLGRPKKAQTGATVWVPAHLLWHVNALLEADKAEQAKRTRPVNPQTQQVSP